MRKGIDFFESGELDFKEWAGVPPFREQMDRFRPKHGLFYREVFYGYTPDDRDFRTGATSRVRSAQKKTPHT